MRIILLIALLWETASLAQTSCKIEDTVRCLCTHSMSVSCDNGTRGHISNNEKVASITVRVIDNSGGSQLVTLNNPPGGVMDLYAANYNDWVKAQLSAKGIRFVDAIGESFTTTNAPALFADPDGKNPISTQSSSSSSLVEGLNCTATFSPTVIKVAGANCNGKNICHFRARCTEVKAGRVVENLGEFDLACKTLADGTCPQATQCAKDSEVTLEQGTWAPTSGQAGGAAQPAGGAQ